MIIVTHVAKTGGTSFRDYLRRSFGGRLYLDYKKYRTTEVPRWRRLLGQLLRQPQGLPWGVACIMGHFQATKYDAVFPQARHAIWLREPVQRVVSHYQYYVRLPNGPHPMCRLLHERGLSLTDFAQLEQTRNMQTRVVHGKPMSGFAFVGLTEHFPLGLQLFARIFNCPEPAGVPLINRNPERRGTSYQLSPGERELIRRCNDQDEALYRQAEERFAQLCHTYGLPIPAATTPLGQAG